MKNSNRKIEEIKNGEKKNSNNEKFKQKKKKK